MKTGMLVDEFVAEIHRLDQTKLDIVSPTDELSYAVGENVERLWVKTPDSGTDLFELTAPAALQVAERCGIPKAYRDKMLLEVPDLMMTNVNRWFRAKPERRLVRILDGKARAFLSDRYARIDHVDVLRAIEEPLSRLVNELGARVESAQLTEQKMYVKIVVPGIESEVTLGDVVQAGFVISNSETGHGAFTVQQMVFRLACLNGMIRGETLRKTHVGARITDNGDVWGDDTREADDRVTLLAARDVVSAAVDRTRFEAVVARMRETTMTAETTEPIGVVERLAKTHGLTDAEGQLVLSCFVRDAGTNGLNHYGLVNAVTAASQKVPDYTRATELEQLGGTLLDSRWDQVVGIR
jgi:hypothetical protein